MAKRLTLLLGGARSGKSGYAEEWASRQGTKVLFVATAEALDSEMAGRIARHRSSRPPAWLTLEVPVAVAEAIRAQPPGYDALVLDCVTLLVSNVLMRLPEHAGQDDVDAAVSQELDLLLSVYEQSGVSWLLVSNEVGMGLVPPTPLSRRYRDALGRANQRLAEAADEVALLVAGLPWRLKG
jgi:adenosylcobinamide kinase / adenosylcobinamide-phosphate guanylyltransferase